jgi:hypothetical protein
MAELVAHTDQPAPSRSAASSTPDGNLDLSARRFRPANRVAARLWRKRLAELVFPHIELSLQRVRRLRRVHGWLAQLGTCVSLLVWASLTLLSVQTVFAAQPGATIGRLVPTALLTLPAWVLLRLQRFVLAWISSRERDLRDQELIYLACASAIAQNRDEVFRQALETVVRQASEFPRAR